jgi:quinol monooxygenase YgiN
LEPESFWEDQEMSTGVTITLEIIFNPGICDAFCASLPEVLKETATRPGFRTIRAVRHKDDADRVLMIEQWDSEKHYQDYVAWRTERGDMAKLGPNVKSMQMNCWPQHVASV